MSLKMKKSISTLTGTPHGQAGLTLIELMVGLVIGLILAIVASSTYLYSKQAYSAVSETSQMEENGRFALDLLAKNIQGAGFVSIDPKSQGAQGPSDMKIRGCSLGMVNPLAPSATTDLDNCVSSTPAGSSPSASIATFYDTDAYSSTGAAYKGFDCMGNSAVTVPSATGGSPSYSIRNYFFISTSQVQTPYGTTTMGQLSCAVNPTLAGGTATWQPAQPLIPGIQQLFVSYLLPSANDSTSAQARTTADALNLNVAPVTWSKVAAVELCVLTKSIQASGNDTGTQVTDCFGNSFTPQPYQSYRRFTTIVNLRNRSTS